MIKDVLKIGKKIGACFNGELKLTATKYLPHVGALEVNKEFPRAIMRNLVMFSLSGNFRKFPDMAISQ